MCVKITGLSCSRMNAEQDASREGFFIFTSPPWQGWLVVTLIKVGANQTSRYTVICIKKQAISRIKQASIQNVEIRGVDGIVRESRTMNDE